jgi:hypothetical protein
MLRNLVGVSGNGSPFVSIKSFALTSDIPASSVHLVLCEKYLNRQYESSAEKLAAVKINGTLFSGLHANSALRDVSRKVLRGGSTCET